MNETLLTERRPFPKTFSIVRDCSRETFEKAVPLEGIDEDSRRLLRTATVQIYQEC